MKTHKYPIGTEVLVHCYMFNLWHRGTVIHQGTDTSLKPSPFGGRNMYVVSGDPTPVPPKHIASLWPESVVFAVDKGCGSSFSDLMSNLKHIEHKGK